MIRSASLSFQGEMSSNPAEHISTSLQINMTRQLSRDQLLLELQNLFSMTYHIDMPSSLELSLNEMIKRASSSNIPSNKLYEFSMEKKKQKLVRIVNQSIPDGIFPKHYTGNLYDIKVGGQGPDDRIYNQHASIRKFIPRGTTLMSIDGINREENLDVVIYAMRKFTGGIGDDDESEPENNEIWRSYCLDDTEKAEKVVAMEKLNGEAAHFSGRFIDDKFYIITGSKNVHMIICCEEDVEKYEGIRYNNAKVIARAVWKHFVQLREKNREILFSLLHHTNCTVVCEILLPDNQHIVNLSSLKEPSLHVISMTPTISDKEETSLIALPPHHCIELLSALGFIATPYKIIDRQDLDKFIQRSRNEINKEGYVLYYLKMSSGYENTIGMAKTKTVWYVILRALREKAVFTFTTAKKRNGWSLDRNINSTHKRFNEIQRWLKFSNEHLSEWNKLSEQFLHWLDGEININSEAGESIRPNFPIIWDRFLKNTGNQLSVIK
ncbi:unnamed protein product [Meganyctiphanes norvegica]|uniref:T4 RNA ligase 1-like N-terminal domain-containing protein n=1 Tax=Meganyctiphanes norvegica TaxID=48144 RepID=A0AAV2PUV8_MEGNR